jgi:hypothetical protein
VQPSTTTSSENPAPIDRAKQLVEQGDLPAALASLSAIPAPADMAKAHAELAAFLYKARKDVSGMLDCGRAGIARLLAAADQISTTDQVAAAQLEDRAKTLAFNVAANCWPGWDDDGIALTTEHIQAGLALAEQSLELVRKLRLGEHREGTSYWLVGALHLALGQNGLAAPVFDRAKAAFDAAHRPIESLMVSGYRAVADQRDDAKHNRAVREFATILSALESENSDKAKFFARQLRTAERVLNR